MSIVCSLAETKSGFLDFFGNENVCRADVWWKERQKQCDRSNHARCPEQAIIQNKLNRYEIQILRHWLPLATYTLAILTEVRLVWILKAKPTMSISSFPLIKSILKQSLKRLLFFSGSWPENISAQNFSDFSSNAQTLLLKEKVILCSKSNIT